VPFRESAYEALDSQPDGVILHSLKPFNADSDLRLGFGVERTADRLQFEFHLSDISRIKFPEAKPAPDRQRRDELWRTTCFEIFAGAQNQKSYLEMNLSPSGDWNAYAFNDYREGMRPAGVTLAPLVVSDSRVMGKQKEMILRGFLAADEIKTAGPLALSAAAVLEYESGAIEYWALKHAQGSRPDFHLRESFILAL
jgi:hypothetical protein